MGPGNGCGRLVGMITGRDVCMVAESQGKAFKELLVGDAMEPAPEALRQPGSLDVVRRTLTKKAERAVNEISGLLASICEPRNRRRAQL